MLEDVPRARAVELHFMFDSDDITRIARSQGISPGEVDDDHLHQWMVDILSTELMRPDPFEGDEA